MVDYTPFSLAGRWNYGSFWERVLDNPHHPLPDWSIARHPITALFLRLHNNLLNEVGRYMPISFPFRTLFHPVLPGESMWDHERRSQSYTLKYFQTAFELIMRAVGECRDRESRRIVIKELPRLRELLHGIERILRPVQLPKMILQLKNCGRSESETLDPRVTVISPIEAGDTLECWLGDLIERNQSPYSSESEFGTPSENEEKKIVWTNYRLRKAKERRFAKKAFKKDIETNGLVAASLSEFARILNSVSNSEYSSGSSSRSRDSTDDFIPWESQLISNEDDLKPLEESEDSYESSDNGILNSISMSFDRLFSFPLSASPSFSTSSPSVSPYEIDQAWRPFGQAPEKIMSNATRYPTFDGTSDDVFVVWNFSDFYPASTIIDTSEFSV